jgi:hypothetical protein
MTEEDRVLLDVDYGGFVPREEKRQRESRWNALAFLLRTGTQRPSTRLERLVDATLRQIKWCRTSMIPARVAELNVGMSNSRSMLSTISG